LHTALGIVVEQETLTAWLNEPAAVAWKFTGDDVVPCGAEMLVGEGAVSPKSMTCKVSDD